ncbi:MAG: hypothetical protein OXG19_00020 [Chloroflexi bacterium]|nr:hypothetical protein [Chloroflexota bacterium]
MTATPTTATLDTSVMQEFWRDQNRAEAVRQLLCISGRGEIDLVVTTRISADVPRPPLAERINELPDLGVETIGSSFRVGVSRVGGKDMIVGPRAEELASFIEEQAQKLGLGKRRPDWRDADHLYGHMVARRDVFLTWDRGILDLAEALHERFGLTVMQPEAFVASTHDSRRSMLLPTLE